MKWSDLFRVKNINDILPEENPHGSASENPSLKRTLTVVDLTSFGIAAVVGAGIFSTIGNASFNGGPAVVFLFIFTAIACAFSAMCYAEFASRIPAAGSAYTYAYASFGELLAWIIGWDLVMEYAIGNIAVAISWSDYFTGLLGGYGIHIAKCLTMDFLTSSRGFDQVSELLAQGKSLIDVQSLVSANVYDAYLAWTTAPRIGNIPLVCDLPALAITVVITTVVYVGIQESKRASNLMVALKLGVILFVIALGAFYVHPENWSPFAPNGVSGVMKGVSAVFFAYIGFDAISTTAEECKNPQRDLPRSMIYSLSICTVLYVAVTLILTGIVSYKSLQVGDPLAYVFGPEGANIPWISGIIAVSAVIAMASVLLVFQIGQPRIWMAMSRDGLLPPIFSSIHPKYKTPWFSTLLTGVVVAVPSLFLNLTEVTDLTSIGTLFAFTLVCGGVLMLQANPDYHVNDGKKRFKTPYINSKWIAPALFIICAVSAIVFNPEGVSNFFSSIDPSNPELQGWEVFKHKIPLIVFMIGMAFLSILCFIKNFSLIPVLGLASCGYLMTELGILNWIRFGMWLAVGMAIYFSYGFRKSKLAR